MCLGFEGILDHQVEDLDRLGQLGVALLDLVEPFDDLVPGLDGPSA